METYEFLGIFLEMCERFPPSYFNNRCHSTERKDSVSEAATKKANLILIDKDLEQVLIEVEKFVTLEHDSMF